MIIRSAEERDAEAVAGIWNRLIRDSIATFNSVEKSSDEVRRMIAEKERLGQNFLVADRGRVTGFATYGQFRNGIGYSRTMEHTIHLAFEERGKGTGRSMLGKLERFAASRGVHSFIAGISGENDPAVQFHEAMGYGTVARLCQVGYKYGRWFDLVLMQKMLEKVD